MYKLGARLTDQPKGMPMRKDRLVVSDKPNEYNATSARIKMGDIIDNACFHNVVSTIWSSNGRHVAVIPYQMLRELHDLRAAQSAKGKTFSAEQHAAHKALHKAVQEYAALFPVTSKGKE